MTFQTKKLFLKKLSKHKISRRNEKIKMRVKEITERQQRKSLRQNAGLLRSIKLLSL